MTAAVNNAGTAWLNGLAGPLAVIGVSSKCSIEKHDAVLCYRLATLPFTKLASAARLRSLAVSLPSELRLASLMLNAGGACLAFDCHYQ